MSNTKELRLDNEILDYAVLGGTILGGGGGGDPKKGKKYAQIAVNYSELFLKDINSLNNDDILITASLVGAPNAENQYMTAKDIVQTIEILQKNYNGKIAGIITNEQGGEATTNGWLQASICGLPIIDAPCNGRAHPTGVMGSIGLHKVEDYITIQACVGGNPNTGNRVSCSFEGTIEHTSKLVRLASIEAGGLVAVARNPVSVEYAKKNCAIGGVSHSIEVGKVYAHALKDGVEKGIEALCECLKGKVLAKGIVEHYSIETTGGFDVGNVLVDGCELTFWNEYATAEKDGKRLATFPDLIMTLDAITGEPLTTAAMDQGKEVYVIATEKSNLKLASTMFDKDLLKTMQDVVNRELLSYL